MQLFYAPGITPPVYTFPEEESKHCIKVLRLSKGDIMHITDGAGNLHTAVIEDADPRRCSVRITDTVHGFGKLPYNLTIAAAPTKNSDRYEWFLEKATETGISHIIPIRCDHSERTRLNHERSERVIASAMKQSLKAYMPELDEMTPVKEVIGMPFAGQKFIAHCREGERTYLGDIVEKEADVLILIGPEGDFSQEEIRLAVAAGFIPVSLGTSRLRTETAALAAATIVAAVNNMKR